MKKLFLLTITAGLAMSSFAQNTISAGNRKQAHLNGGFTLTTDNPANKTTNGYDTFHIISDTVTYNHLGATDTTPYVYPANQGTGTDSGFYFGTSYVGFNAFAERYSFNGTDSIQVLGILGGFTGSAAPSSTHNVTFNVWTEGAPDTASATLIYSGFPNTVVKSQVVSFNSIGFDMLKAYWFSTPTAYMGADYFIGFNLSYSWASMGGDTLSVFSSGARVSSIYTVASGDTTVNDQTVIGQAGIWGDVGFDLNSAHNLATNYWMFPIVNTKRDSIVGVPSGITKKNFTFHGNYPNPAVNYTNVDFTVANNTDVTIQVMDINGRTVRTINENNVATGRHTIRIETSDLAAGDYVYLIRTTEGGGIASKISVIK